MQIGWNTGCHPAAPDDRPRRVSDSSTRFAVENRRLVAMAYREAGFCSKICFMMRDHLLSNATPATSVHRRRDFKQKSDDLKSANTSYKPCSPSRECTLRAQGLEATTAFDVGIWVEIAAEWRRVFRAISIPEYIEAWMEFPDQCGSNHWVYVGKQDVLCINRTCSSDAAHIYRLRMHIRQKSLTILWESLEPNLPHASRVEIVIGGARQRCYIRLRHTGLRHWDERQMYCGMWSRSLDKLQRILQ